MLNYLNMIFDLHIHTTLSHCSNLAFEEIIDSALLKGLDGVCITDHDTMAVGKYIKEGIQQNGLCVIVGMEYTTQDGEWLRIGQAIHCEFTILLSSKGSSTGDAVLTGLPFDAWGNSAQNFGMTRYSNLAYISGRDFVFFTINASGSTLTLQMDGDSTGTSILQDTNFSSTTRITSDFIYLTDDL